MIGDLEFAATDLGDHAVHARKIAVDQIDGNAVDAEPGAAIDPGTPAAQGRREITAMIVIEQGGGGIEGGDIQAGRAAIAKADIDVGMGVVPAAGTAAAEHQSANAANGRHRSGDFFENRIDGTRS